MILQLSKLLKHNAFCLLMRRALQHNKTLRNGLHLLHGLVYALNQTSSDKVGKKSLQMNNLPPAVKNITRTIKF